MYGMHVSPKNGNGSFNQWCIFSHKSTLVMIKHLQEHRDAGHDVPDGIDERLLEDDKENFK